MKGTMLTVRALFLTQKLGKYSKHEQSSRQAIPPTLLMLGIQTLRKQLEDASLHRHLQQFCNFQMSRQATCVLVRRTMGGGGGGGGGITIQVYFYDMRLRYCWRE